MATSNRDFWNWFAGFVDGEGCFGIAHRRTCYTPTFALCLRADDRAILEEIQLRLGVCRFYTYTPWRVDLGRRCARVELRATNKAACVRLVEIFDEHPLRAKKAQDFEIWREAVLLWTQRVGHHGSGREPHLIQSKMAALKVTLESGRRFEPEKLLCAG
jgi:hypothetical protein